MSNLMYFLLGVVLVFSLALISTMPVGATELPKFDHDKEAGQLFLQVHLGCSEKAYQAQEEGEHLHPGRILYLQCMGRTYTKVHESVVEMWEKDNKIL